MANPLKSALLILNQSKSYHLFTLQISCLHAMMSWQPWQLSVSHLFAFQAPLYAILPPWDGSLVDNTEEATGAISKWFGTIEFYDFPKSIGNFSIPTDFHIFQRLKPPISK